MHLTLGDRRIKQSSELFSELLFAMLRGMGRDLHCNSAKAGIIPADVALNKCLNVMRGGHCGRQSNPDAPNPLDPENDDHTSCRMAGARVGNYGLLTTMGRAGWSRPSADLRQLEHVEASTVPHRLAAVPRCHRPTVVDRAGGSPRNGVALVSVRDIGC